MATVFDSMGRDIQALADCIDAFGKAYGRDDETYKTAVRKLNEIAGEAKPKDERPLFHFTIPVVRYMEHEFSVEAHDEEEATEKAVAEAETSTVWDKEIPYYKGNTTESD